MTDDYLEKLCEMQGIKYAILPPKPNPHDLLIKPLPQYCSVSFEIFDKAGNKISEDHFYGRHQSFLMTKERLQKLIGNGLFPNYTNLIADYRNWKNTHTWEGVPDTFEIKFLSSYELNSVDHHRLLNMIYQDTSVRDLFFKKIPEPNAHTRKAKDIR